MAAAGSSAETTSERAWWLRLLLVLQAPRSVFAALRDDSDEAAAARQEPVTAVVLLAGLAGVLATSVTRELLNDPEFDGLLIAVWAFVAAVIHGIGAYFLLGGLVYAGATLAGGTGSYRRARHVLAYATVPLALSLVVWPVRLAVHGGDTFRRGGNDSGAGNAAFELLEVAAIAWAVALLAIGIMTVHGWRWPRAVAVSAAPAAVPALAFARAWGVI